MDRKNFLKLSVLFAAVYFFSTNGLGALPGLSINFLLKDKLNLTPAGMAYFQAVTILAWVVKPLWGFISDSMPIFGYRRKSYLILASLLAGISWAVLGFIQSYSVALLLLVITISQMAYAFQDVVTDGLMVEKGKPENLTGQFQSIQWSSVYIAMILTALLGGAISDLTRGGKMSYQLLFLSVALFPFLVVILSMVCIDEPRMAKRKPEKKINFKEVFLHKDLLLLAFFLFFWKFSPSFNAPFFYYAVDTLKFNGSFIGILQAIAAGAGLIGAILFGKYFSDFSIRKLLVFSVLVGALMTLTDYTYFIPQLVAHPETLKWYALLSRVPLGILDTLIFLTALNLAAKASPVYAGGAVFAFLTSASNLGLMGSSAVGGMLFSMVGLKPLVFISALFSLLAFLFLPYLAIDEPLTKSEQAVKNFLSFLKK